MAKAPLSSSELEAKIAELQKQVDALQIENTKMEIICMENGLLDDIATVSDTESICTLQIKRLKEKSQHSDFSETDAKILDILHKNLRMAKDQVLQKDNSRKTKGMSSADLLKLVVPDGK
jgi:hypothetical protein